MTDTGGHDDHGGGHEEAQDAQGEEREEEGQNEEDQEQNQALMTHARTDRECREKSDEAKAP
jgi:hypothetical protein